MFLRSLLCLVLLGSSVLGAAQDMRWSLGTDPSLWLSGWRNAQVGVQCVPELSLMGGVGWMSGSQAGAGTIWRLRPVEYDQALMANIGLRLHPGAEEGRKFQGLVGMEYSQEWYSSGDASTADLDFDLGEVPLKRQFSRSDLRLLAGGRVLLSPSFTLSAHAGVGYAFRSGADWIGAGPVTGHPAMARLVGMELMWWL